MRSLACLIGAASLALSFSSMAKADAGERQRYFRTISALILQNVNPPNKGYVFSRHVRVVVHLRLDRKGRIVDIHVGENSGHPSFGTAAVAIVRRASKWFPDMPASIPGDSVSVSAPITFRPAGA